MAQMAQLPTHKELATMALLIAFLRRPDPGGMRSFDSLYTGLHPGAGFARAFGGQRKPRRKSGAVKLFPISQDFPVSRLFWNSRRHRYPIDVGTKPSASAQPARS